METCSKNNYKISHIWTDVPKPLKDENYYW